MREPPPDCEPNWRDTQTHWTGSANSAHNNSATPSTPASTTYADKDSGLGNSTTSTTYRSSGATS